MTTYYEESAAELAEASRRYEDAKQVLADAQIEYDRTYQAYTNAVQEKNDAQVLVNAALAMKENAINKCKAILGAD